MSETFFDQLKLLNGEDVKFSEPNNVGYSILIHLTMNSTGFDVVWAIKFWQLMAFSAFVLTFYILTRSLKMTILVLGYAPLLTNSFLGHAAFDIFLHTFIIYLYIKGRKAACFSVGLVYSLFRHEFFVIYVAFFLHEIYTQKAYHNIGQIRGYIWKSRWYLLLIVLSAVSYMTGQLIYYGHPLANYVFNLSHPISLNLQWYYYAIRIIIFAAILATSVLLFRHNKLLFLGNTLQLILFAYVGLFGNIYAFINIQGYYSWLVIYTVMAIGYISKDQDFMGSDIVMSYPDYTGSSKRI